MRHLVAAGSALGRMHALSDRPNQDAFRVLTGAWGAVAVVCDGCGSEPKSGVGAELGACLTARAAARQLEERGTLDLPRLKQEVLSGLCLAAAAAGLDPREHLLFTIVGAAFASERVTTFACGDGAVAVDGVLRRLGPFPDNAPPYLAYALSDSAVGFQSLFEGPAGRVLIATDGAADLDLAFGECDDKLFANPDLLRRKLKLLKPQDDATVALIRRAS